MEETFPTLILQAIKKRPDWLVIGASVVILSVLWALALFTFPMDTPAAILHYSVGIGIDIIGEGSQILTLPIIGTTLLVFNLVLAQYLKRISGEAFWTLLGFTPLIQIILLAAYSLLWKLN